MDEDDIQKHVAYDIRETSRRPNGRKPDELSHISRHGGFMVDPGGQNGKKPSISCHWIPKQNNHAERQSLFVNQEDQENDSNVPHTKSKRLGSWKIMVTLETDQRTMEV